MKGKDRNAPCPCGSGKKRKNCIHDVTARLQSALRAPRPTYVVRPTTNVSELPEHIKQFAASRGLAGPGTKILNLGALKAFAQLRQSSSSDDQTKADVLAQRLRQVFNG